MFWLLCSLSMLLFAVPVQAHFLAVDGSIGATLHIDPDDAPKAHSPATFFFDIADRTNKFQLANCNCHVIISESGHVLSSNNLAVTGFSQSSLSFTFPGLDVYKIELIGKPEATGQFQPFTISWNIRVDQNAITNPPDPVQVLRFQLIGGALCLLLVLLTATALRRHPENGVKKPKHKGFGRD